MDHSEKLKLYGFNNLTKALSFNIYDVCYAKTPREQKDYIAYIDQQYNSERLTRILTSLTDMIGARVLSISQQDYDPQGASVTLLIAEGSMVPVQGETQVAHLDKSHVTVHTYPEYHPETCLATFRVDIDVATCGEITPLSTLDYLIGSFDSDIITMDYRVRGFTRDVDGKKLFMDREIRSIQDYISKETLRRYDVVDINVYEANLFHTKMMLKEIDLQNYLSQAYHYVAEQLFRERRKKTGEKVRTRLIYHQIWFMDDILLLGTSARDLEKGMKLLSEFVSQNLGLTIKPEWRVETTDYIGADGKHHGHDIDMMGYRVYCDHISIRRRTFKRHRRTILRAWAKLGRGQSLPLATCRRIMSCKGKFKNSNSAAVSKRLKIARLERIASRTISAYDKDRAEALKKERREYHEKHSTCTGEAGRIAVHDAPRWAGGCLDQKEYRPAALPF